MRSRTRARSSSSVSSSVPPSRYPTVTPVMLAIGAARSRPVPTSRLPIEPGTRATIGALVGELGGPVTICCVVS
jgi:hypothetical protein